MTETKPALIIRLLHLGESVVSNLLAGRPSEAKAWAAEYDTALQTYKSRSRTKIYRGKINSSDNRLTSREMQVITRYNKGEALKSISDSLKITVGTVKVHLSSARKKTGVNHGSTPAKN